MREEKAPPTNESAQFGAPDDDVDDANDANEHPVDHIRRCLNGSAARCEILLEGGPVLSAATTIG